MAGAGEERAVAKIGYISVSNMAKKNDNMAKSGKSLERENSGSGYQNRSEAWRNQA